LEATGVTSFDPETGKLTIPVDTVLAFDVPQSTASELR
jgi:Cu/Ag efflux protein CusF